MSEAWRACFGGNYEVSDHGNVRRATPGRGTYVGRPVRPIPLPTGYFQVAPVVDGRNVKAYLHRVVTEAFLGPCPEGKEVNHKDGNKGNNRLENLEYMTRGENVRHAHATGLIPKRIPKPKKPLKGRQEGETHWTRLRPEDIARGERCGSTKMNADRIALIRARVAGGEKQRAVAADMGISPAQVCRIVNRKHWRHEP